MTKTSELAPLLARIAKALERSFPAPAGNAQLSEASGYIWSPLLDGFEGVKNINALPLSLLQAIDQQKNTLLANSLQFAQGYGANNALLWGARGMGKSSLVKSVHRELVEQGHKIKLVEIHREDINSLPRCLQLIKQSDQRIILYCDDLSFDNHDSSYKSLKAVLEGGLQGRPANVIFYATSNRRHLMPREMIENERSTAINPAEAVEEKISLSDRFGLWIGFHNCSQEEFLAMVREYADFYGIRISDKELKAAAIEWSATRGARSGRVAAQFITDLAGQKKQRLER